MILTNCAACAAPLAHDAPRCVRCQNRYCNSTCQHDHWRRGHKQICKKIHRGGNAEQYHAGNRYKEAVAEAVEACADDTNDQTCYICLEAVHSRTGEGLVRGCACGDRDGVDSGTTGVAHVSCLAEQAKILVAEGEENNLGAKALNERWHRWYTCGLCEQDYHGVVRCALGWACWKTYEGRPEEDWTRRSAMAQLGNGLSIAQQHEDALSVKETELAMMRRVGASEAQMLVVQGNLANTYQVLGRCDEDLRLRKEVYSGCLRLGGEEHPTTLAEANNYAWNLNELKRFEEAKSLLRKTMPVARRVLGNNDELTLRMRLDNARALYLDASATLDDFHEAVTTLEETERTARRVLCGAHPVTVWIEGASREERAALATSEPPSGVRKRRKLHLRTSSE